MCTFPFCVCYCQLMGDVHEYFGKRSGGDEYTAHCNEPRTISPREQLHILRGKSLSDFLMSWASHKLCVVE
jgi:hypothetical protein